MSLVMRMRCYAVHAHSERDRKAFTRPDLAKRSCVLNQKRSFLPNVRVSGKRIYENTMKSEPMKERTLRANRSGKV